MELPLLIQENVLNNVLTDSSPFLKELPILITITDIVNNVIQLVKLVAAIQKTLVYLVLLVFSFSKIDV